MYSKHALPKKYQVKSDDIIGAYYTEDDTGKRTDVGITKFNGAGYAYKFSGEPVDPKDPEKYAFNLYQVGKIRLAFVRLPKKSPANQNYFILRLETSRTQQVFTHLNEKFFKANPGALPQTQVNGDTVITSADGDLLAAFFLLHGKNPAIWDSKPAQMFNRVGT